MIGPGWPCGGSGGKGGDVGGDGGGADGEEAALEGLANSKNHINSSEFRGN